MAKIKAPGWVSNLVPFVCVPRWHPSSALGRQTDIIMVSYTTRTRILRKIIYLYVVAL